MSDLKPFLSSRHGFRRSQPHNHSAAEKRGRIAEWLAMIYLLCCGYWPVARRVRTPVGELDWVMIKNDCWIFIEVKWRSSLAQAAYSITPHQQQRWARAAQLYLSKRCRGQAQPPYRFDALLIAPWRWPIHSKNVLQG